MPNIELWTDGSSTGRVGPGGWAYLLKYGEYEKWDSGYSDDTTNQRMEMTAMLMGLRAIKKPMQHVTVFTDSAYVMNAWTQGWLKKWKKNGWRAGPRGSKGPVANRDLWEALVLAADSHMLHFTKVKGHDEDGKFPLNDRVDELSREARLNPEMFVEVELPLIENLALELA